MLTDKTSTDPVTSEICTTINDKPIVSASYMYDESQASSIDLSSFDTSKVTSIYSMFSDSAVTEIDVSKFNTSNVTNMSYMFYDSTATELDLSSFDTTNVTDMSFMFYALAATTGYARTQADADRFNASSNKPSALIFAVK